MKNRFTRMSQMITLNMFYLVIYWTQKYTMTSFFYVVSMCNFACCFVWVWNLVANIAGGKEAGGVWEHGVEENIWA